MRIDRRDALDIVERKIYEARVERVRLKWKNDWRVTMTKLESIRQYLLTHP